MCATDDSYQYKLFNLFPFSEIEFCYVQTLDKICVIKIRDSFFFLATCATSFRIMTPCFKMWVNKYSAKEWIPSIWFLLDHNALHFSFCCKRNPEDQAQCDCFFFFLLCSFSESQIEFSVSVYSVCIFCNSPSFLGKMNK